MLTVIDISKARGNTESLLTRIDSGLDPINPEDTVWIVRADQARAVHDRTAQIVEGQPGEDKRIVEVAIAIMKKRMPDARVATIVSFSGIVLNEVPRLAAMIGFTVRSRHIYDVTGDSMAPASGRPRELPPYAVDALLRALQSGGHFGPGNRLGLTLIRPAMINVDRRCARSAGDVPNYVSGVLAQAESLSFVLGSVKGGLAGYYLTDSGRMAAEAAGRGQIDRHGPVAAAETIPTIKSEKLVDVLTAAIETEGMMCPPDVREGVVSEMENIIASYGENDAPCKADELIDMAIERMAESMGGPLPSEKKHGYKKGLVNILTKSNVMLDESGAPITIPHFLSAVPVHSLVSSASQVIAEEIMIAVLRQVGRIELKWHNALTIVLFGRHNMSNVDFRKHKEAVAIGLVNLHKAGRIDIDGNGCVVLAGDGPPDDGQSLRIG